MLELTAEHVAELFRECLAAQPDSHRSVAVEGLVNAASFDRAKLADYHDVIGDLLYQLPLAFQPVERGGGGGMSFLDACMDRNENHWTGLHLTMEKLFMLGIATGQAQWCLPKNMWSALPGSMPYVAVNPDRKYTNKIGE